MRKILICLLLVATSFVSFAQPDKKIRAQEQLIIDLKRQIARGETEIGDLKRGRASAEETLQRLAQQVDSRNQLLDATQRQAVKLGAEVSRADSVARGLMTSLATHKEQYAAVVREAYRNYRQSGYLTYVFSSDDFHQVTQRVATLREVAALRERQMQRITSLSEEVSVQLADLMSRQRELDSVQRSLIAQRTQLQRDVESARSQIKQLSDKERKALQEKQSREKTLTVAVDELRRLSRDNKMGATFTNKTKGLRVPVTKGRVLRYRNNMAEVTGPKDAAVTAVYEGKVVDVKRNRITNKYDVYIAHGQYISSYANLNSVSVSKNDVVTRNQTIGVIGSGVNVMTMQPEYMMIFGVYAPKPDMKITADTFFKQ